MRSLFFSFMVIGLTACSSSIFYELPALPFSVEFPRSYGFTESETAYYFSSQGGPALFVFEKEPTERAFFELFESGYDEFTEKSSGVWVVCEKSDLSHCFVQNLNFPELYPLHVQTEETATEEAFLEIREHFLHIKAK